MIKPIYNGFQFEIENEEITLLHYINRIATEVEALETIDGFHVTKIGSECFKKGKLIFMKKEKIVIPTQIREEKLTAMASSIRVPNIKYSGYGAYRTDKHPTRARRKVMDRKLINEY